MVCPYLGGSTITLGDIRVRVWVSCTLGDIVGTALTKFSHVISDHLACFAYQLL